MKALVLQSSNPSIFSAGLDIMELHNPKLDRLTEFWKSFQQLYLDLYGSRLACIASLQGTAPAAGCMLALSCDYRILIDHPKAKIGLNETKLGIVAPPWLSRQMVATIGHRRTELGLGLGTLYSPQEALQIGLVDELVALDGDEKASKQQVANRAMEMAAEFAKIPSGAWWSNKEQLRGPFIDSMIEDRQRDMDHFVSFVTRDETQQNLTAYLKALSKKKGTSNSSK